MVHWLTIAFICDGDKAVAKCRGAMSRACTSEGTRVEEKTFGTVGHTNGMVLK